MLQALTPDMLATDLADYLVRKGVPFRETHHIAGACVKLAEDQKKPLSSLTLAELKSIHPQFEADVKNVWNFETSVERKDSTGGTSLRSVLEQVEKIKKFCDQYN